MTHLRCTVYGPEATPNGFDALALEWNNLLHRTRFNSFFLTHEWQTIWWEYLGKGELYILAFHQQHVDSVHEPVIERPAEPNMEAPVDQFEELVGIIPLYRIQRRVDAAVNPGQWVFTLVGCTEVSDYLDAIIAQGWEESVYHSFFQWLQSKDAPQWDRLDLCNLPEASVTYQLLPQLLEGKSFAVSVSQEDVAPYFVLPTRYETYLEEIVDKKQRHEIRRKQRRAEREAACEFVMVGQDVQRRLNQPNMSGSSLNRSAKAGLRERSEPDIHAEMNEFLRLQMASREDKADFMTDEMAHFFRSMAKKMVDFGYLRLSFLKLDGVTAAGLLAFEYDGRYWLYNSGYDPDVFASLSPGWVLLAYTIQYAIAAGLKIYDFMQGDEAYKYRFGSQDYKVMRVIVDRIQA